MLILQTQNVNQALHILDWTLISRQSAKAWILDPASRDWLEPLLW